MTCLWMTSSRQVRTPELEDSEAGEEGREGEGEVDRFKTSQHQEAEAEVEMEPTKPGPGLAAGTVLGLEEEEVGGECAVWRVLVEQVELVGGGEGPGRGQQ